MSTDQELLSDQGEPSEKMEELPYVAAFLFQFEQETQIDQKIRLSLDFMRAALSGAGTPRFRDFWEGRRLCLPLFKEALSPKSRSVLWAEYIELSAEARRIKEILDEQSAFAIEQIELAIQALERDLEHYDLNLSLAPQLAFPEPLVLLKAKRHIYETLQKELNLLNTMAARINGLRKEVIKTEMRIRTKNKLFERLSLCGDRVFPQRKELIKSISHEFIHDVNHFVDAHFTQAEVQKVPLYALREEIKAFQSLAKFLTLNTHSFTETRQKLSGCWDQVKQQERERKKEFAQKKQEFRQNYDAVMEKINAFAVVCGTEITLDDANKAAQELLDMMAGLELGRDEVKSLRDAIHRAKRPIFEKAQAIEEERLKKEREIESAKRQRVHAVKQSLQDLLELASGLDCEQLALRRDELLKEFESVALSKADKQVSDRGFKQLKDLISEKKERALMDLSEDDLKSLEQLKAMLIERKERRREIKAQLEVYRKALGGSGFDFEKAMMYREMIEAEKTTLEKINHSIDEIEEKIDQIEG